ncbi:MAG TPA: ribbon-helix-helix domain-containing protein [Myxococcaceae bacterium]|jgi:predicted DNA-binding protein|nr:ribbon-helix-helix domain-containing protein [Myxococcaceae bacterium]
MPTQSRLTSVVFRLTKDRLDALKTLSRATRIRQSEYLREAIADLLVKYAVPAEVPAPGDQHH